MIELPPLEAEVGQGLQHFAFKALHQFERDIKEIPRATSRVKNSNVAKPRVKGSHFGDSAFDIAFVALGFRRALDARPLFFQRLQNRRRHEPFDVGAGRVMGAELASLGGVQGLLKQRAENGRLDLPPVGLGGFVKLTDLLARQAEHSAVFEQIAVELLHVALERERKSALVHRLPQLSDHAQKEIWIFDASLEHVAKAAFGQQLNVLGEHCEKAAHVKERDLLGIIEALAVLALGVFKMPGDLGQPLRHGACGFRCDFARVEFVRIEPDEPQALADFRVAKLFEIDAKPLPVWKLRVIFSLAREVGVDLEAMADIADDQERRPAF
jgi:hypothetical protein